MYYNANGNKLLHSEVQWCVANHYVYLNDVDTINNQQVVNPDFIQRLVILCNYSHVYFKENEQRPNFGKAPVYLCYDPLTGISYYVDKNHTVFPVK